jgi:hypothetical protein
MLGSLLAGPLIMQTVVAVVIVNRPALTILSRWMKALSVHAGRPERRAVTTGQSDLVGSNRLDVRGHFIGGTLSPVRSGWRSRLPLPETQYDCYVPTAFAGNGQLPVMNSGETVRIPFGRCS